MPPHCDSMDGPVVLAAREALETGDVERVLAYVPASGEPEVREAFGRTRTVRALGAEAREVADRWFFETAVRVHRAGEGAPYTGLKPAGGGFGPVIPVAERALETGGADELAGVLCGIVREQVERRLARAMALRERAGDGLAAARESVEAGLGLLVWAHGLYRKAVGEPHGHRPAEG